MQVEILYSSPHKTITAISKKPPFAYWKSLLLNPHQWKEKPRPEILPARKQIVTQFVSFKLQDKRMNMCTKYHTDHEHIMQSLQLISTAHVYCPQDDPI